MIIHGLFLLKEFVLCTEDNDSQLQKVVDKAPKPDVEIAVKEKKVEVPDANANVTPTSTSNAKRAIADVEKDKNVHSSGIKSKRMAVVVKYDV